MEDTSKRPASAARARCMFVACVGLQAGAVASPWITWRNANTDAEVRVVLHATERTRPIAESLARWMQTSAGARPADEIHVVSAISDVSRAARELKKWHPTSEVVFASDGGQAHTVAGVEWHLQRHTVATIVGNRLVLYREGIEQDSLAVSKIDDIELLKLCGLEIQNDESAPDPPEYGQVLGGWLGPARLRYADNRGSELPPLSVLRYSLIGNRLRAVVFPYAHSDRASIADFVARGTRAGGLRPEILVVCSTASSHKLAQRCGFSVHPAGRNDGL